MCWMGTLLQLVSVRKHIVRISEFHKHHFKEFEACVLITNTFLSHLLQKKKTGKVDFSKC